MKIVSFINASRRDGIDRILDRCGIASPAAPGPGRNVPLPGGAHRFQLAAHPS